MKLGGKILSDLFHDGVWRAYRGETLMAFEEVSKLIGPNSIDVTLSDKFLMPVANRRMVIKMEEVDPRDASSLEWESVDCVEMTINPSEFMLGAVNERFVCDAPVTINKDQFPDRQREAYFAPMYEGRSSCGRLGLASHITSGFGDYGFAGAFTLEMYNHFPRPILLYAGMRIGQVAFEEIFMPKRYEGAYSGTNHNDGPVPPKLGPDRF